MIIFMVNDIISYNNSNEVIKERILWIDSKYQYCFTIKLHTNKMIIQRKEIRDIEDTIEISTDITNELISIEDDFEKKHKDSMEKKFEIIKYIMSECPEPYIFDRKYRGKVIIDATNKFNLSNTVIYKYLRLYFQGGKLKSSLLPKYSNSGGAGKERVFSRKTGRHSYEEIISDKKIGIIITDNIKNIFEMVLNKYYRNQKEISINQVYKLMIKDYFSDIIDGELIVKNKYQIPTFNQFYYWVKNKRNIKLDIKKRLGERKYELKYRQLPSNTLKQVLGPGSRYEIDSTIGDVYLVSRIDRSKVLGRPTVYLVIDVFSRLITGMHITLKNPSWECAASAIYNCSEDKVLFCEKYGIKITNDEWPAQGLPSIILADRGELIGPIGEPIISKLNIALENTPTGRGDRKPIVEQTFHRINTRIKALLPGAVKKNYRERGDRDYRFDARLDIYEYTQLVLVAIKNINKSLLDEYKLTSEMIADGIRAIPIELWKWGMVNRTGKLRKINNDILKFHLMKKGTASVTERGIKYKKMIYTTKLAEENGWFELARIKGYKNIPIVFDDNDMTYIYIYDEIANKYIECKLRDEYGICPNLTLFEIEGFQFSSVVENSKSQDYKNQIDAEMYSEIDRIMNANLEKTNGKTMKMSIENMKNNKKLEVKQDYKSSKENDLNKNFENNLTNDDNVEDETTLRELDVLNNIRMRRKINEK